MTEVPRRAQEMDDIWSRGCRGADLKPEEQKRFAAMARSRFHTFTMGMDHARKNADENYVLGLIKGLARELQGAPGLLTIWERMDISESDDGEQVSLMVEKLQQDVH